MVSRSVHDYLHVADGDEGVCDGVGANGDFFVLGNGRDAIFAQGLSVRFGRGIVMDCERGVVVRLQAVVEGRDERLDPFVGGLGVVDCEGVGESIVARVVGDALDGV